MGRAAPAGLHKISVKSLKSPEWRRLARRAKYRAGGLAALLEVSRRQLQRHTRRAFGKSPQEWLDQERLKHAAKSLRSGGSVKLVAFSLGFKQVSHFSREFRRFHGVPPSKLKLL